MANNPNSYDDAKYAKANGLLTSALDAMWNAGATLDNIEVVVQDALIDATDDEDLMVSIMGETNAQGV